MNREQLTAKQKGKIGEALVTASRTTPPDTIQTCIRDNFLQRPQLNPEREEIDVRVGRPPRAYVYDCEGERKQWSPDCSFFATWRPSNPRVEPVRFKYPAEVKTGSYAELERDQREVMELASRGDVQPLLIQIDLASLPEEYGIKVNLV